MKFKKAISPLIATILLIVVAVALIAIVVAWGKSFTTDSLSDATGVVDTSCMGAAIQLSGCTITDTNDMVFYIQNTGSVNFPAGDDFTINLFNEAEGTSKLNLSVSQTATTGWAGITPGQTAMITLEDANFPTTASGGHVSDEVYRVEVISEYCSSDAIAQIKKCSK
jgi:flagellin-like protein